MNMRSKKIMVVLLTTLLILTTVNPACFAMDKSTSQTAVNLESEQQLRGKIKQKLDTISVPFVENKGQMVDEKIRYIANTIMGKAYVTDEGIEYAVFNDECIVFIKEKFNGGNVVKAGGINKAKTKINYFGGNDKSKWLRDVASYDEITYGQVYDNIEVNLKAYNNNIEKLFKVNPGGVPEDIQVQVLGATGLGVTEHGELEIHLQDGTIKMSKPMAFQEEDGKKQEIQVKYTVDGNEYGFEVGKYDQTLPLIIDPFIASTFFGGSGEDQLTSMVIDDEGNIYIAGHTKSADFPNKSDREYTHGDNYFEWDPMGSWWGDDPEPPTRTSRGTTYDVFVSKLNKDMTQLLASTYIGGNENDYVYALTVDDKGNVYVAGRTTSTGIRPYGDDYIEWEGFEYDPDDWEDCWDDYITFEIEPPTAFPTTEGAYQTEPLTDRGFNNYFVTKLDNNLDDIIASTLLGEGTDGTDGINGIKIDSNGDILVVGKTGSLNGFSVSGNPSYEPLYGFTAGDDGKGKNGFIAKFNDSLTEIKGYTFLGGGGILHGAFRDNGTSIEAIVLDNQDNIYITGSTADVNFPTTDDAFCGEHNEKEGNWPGDDAFIAKLNNNLDILISSTLLGGKSSDGGVDIELDTDGSVFITGTTMSEDFPVGSGAYQRNLKKHQSSTYHDIFISRLNNDLSELLAGTYIGGQNREDVFGLALDEGFVYVTGSTMGEYPTTDDSTGRIVISKLNKDLTELEVSTLLGESGDEGRAIIVREDGVYVSGKTSSKNFPVTDGTYRGESGSGGSGACVFITGFAKESSEEDIEPPVWEKGSIPTAENIGLNELTLVWNKGDVTDNVGVTGFRIYQKDGEYGEEVEYDFVTEVDANTTSYVITGLESTTWYKFKVEAVDAAGNESKTDRVLKVMTEIPDLIISIDGVIEEEFLLGDLLEGLEIDKSWPPEETTAPIVRRMYTAANSYGTKRIYAAEGIRISYLIENLDLTDNSLLTFVSSGMSETFTKAQLEESRFYYPEDGEPIAVEPLLAYMSDSPKDGSQPSFDNMGPETGLRLYFGQREQGEMIAPRYLKEVFHIQITQGEPEPEVDKTALQDKVGEVKGYKEEDYTADSWAAFAEALEGAQLVLGDEKATQGEIDNALDVLNEAIENLVHEDIPTQKYELIVEDSDDYEVRETEVGLILTLKQGVTGFKHFEAMVKAIEEKLGQLEVVFTHLRNNMQQSLNSIQADSDADKIDASAGFNIKPGDVIRIYLVDELTNEIDRNPIIFK